MIGILVNPKWVRMIGWRGRCESCGRYLKAGESIAYRVVTDSARHEDCQARRRL